MIKHKFSAGLVPALALAAAVAGAQALPAVYIVDTNGAIAFACSNPDFRVRLPADEVLAAADPFLTKL